MWFTLVICGTTVVICGNTIGISGFTLFISLIFPSYLCNHTNYLWSHFIYFCDLHSLSLKPLYLSLWFTLVISVTTLVITRIILIISVFTLIISVVTLIISVFTLMISVVTLIISILTLIISVIDTSYLQIYTIFFAIGQFEQTQLFRTFQHIHVGWRIEQFEHYTISNRGSYKQTWLKVVILILG